MAQAAEGELVDRFEQFYRNYYRDAIGDLAENYPDDRSLTIDWTDLYRFDPDLADDYLAQPDQLREYAEEALRLYDLPVDVTLGQAHVRVYNLPDITPIREIRSPDVNSLVAVQGIVRKATDVRPKIQEAAFECQRCGTLTYIPQTAGFQEPHECQGCERQGPFTINYDQSTFVDAQKLRIQESPEGLRGGETPQNIDVNIEDDITGDVTPGDHVTMTGVLRIEQQGSGQDKSRMFDVYMDGHALELEDQEFENMDITEDDKRAIIHLSQQPDIFQRMIDSIAPSIYGYDEIKLAICLQLFSGVTKHLPDESRIRGDFHILLIGDPGTGKSQLLQYIRHIAPRSVYTSGKGSSSAGLCVTGDTIVHTEDGFKRIRELAEQYHPEPVSVDTAAEESIGMYTFDRSEGEMKVRSSSRVWRMPEKPCRRLETSHGKELEASRDTPVLTCGERGIEWKPISEVDGGDYVAVPRYDDIERTTPPVENYLEFTNEKVKLDEESHTFIRQNLYDRFGTLRDAAADLGVSEDFIYSHLWNRHVPLEKLDSILDAIGATRADVTVERAMLRHGNSISIPHEFDEDLMYFIGLVYGDGDIALSRRENNRGLVRISNSDEDLLRRALDIIDETFDKQPDIEYQDNRVPSIRLYSATIARFLRNVGMTTPKDELAIHERLTTAENVDAFLRGLMDADGSVSSRTNGGSSIHFSTISEELAQQVQLMLETYGVRARVRERDRRGEYERADGLTIETKKPQYHVEIYGADIERYAEAIGFNSVEKQVALERITTDAERRGETIPVAAALAGVDEPAGKYYMNLNRGDNPGRGRASAILDDLDLGQVEPVIEEAVEADLRWDEVVAAVDTGQKEVFDLTVPETHNFVGNGIVTHNTAAAVRDDFAEGQQWTLEAGALVLADKGTAAVDELDKMRCVTGDSLVHLSDGSVRRIGELADEAAELGSIEQHGNGRTIRDVEYGAWTMADTGAIVRRPVTAIHEYEAPEALTEVRLATGERLTATENHPFFVREAGGRIERSAADLDEGDWVFVPRAVPSPASDGGVESIQATNTANRPLESPSDTGPTPALGAVLGYLCGDGNVYYNHSEGSYGIRFTNGEEELLADFERACRDAFNGQPSRYPSEQRPDGVETVRLYGKEYADTVLEAGMNLETYDGKAFPTAVSAGTRATKAAFVRALADSEGTVDTKTGNVRLYSASHDLLLGTKELLLEFGVSSQITRRERSDRRDVYRLAITDAASIAAFARHVGFTLERKRDALDRVVESAESDRTILDVIPNAAGLLQECREGLRLYQAECGICDATYCDFEQGKANPSIHRARRILDAFEQRKRQAERDLGEVALEPDARTESMSWERLRELRERYHVSQAELADGTEYSQQQISAQWNEQPELRRTVRDRLQTIIGAVASVDLEELRSLVHGKVKWRQVESVEQTSPAVRKDEVRKQKEALADVIGSAEDIVGTARDLLADEPAPDSLAGLKQAMERHGVSLAAIARDLGVSSATISRWFSGQVATDRYPEIREAALDRITQVRQEVAGLLDEIESLRTPRVYDLSVAGTANFIANGMVVHNSEDRSALHQGLEQQEISISKAGINATLKSRCSLLGAANPKYGRFDEYEPIAEQIELDPALISRFDLIFTVTDQPDEEEDRRLAEHILMTNYAGELNTQYSELNTPNASREEVEALTKEVEPSVEPELFRKYIAYAKRNCFPTMSEGAREAIEEFYVNLRARGAGEDAPVPVTARKLEALVRLSEASARVRLSDTVEREDAERVIEIVRSCLRDIGVDPETGEFDADIIETGTSKSQRDRIKNLKTLIEDIEEDFDHGAPVDEILARVDEIGLDEPKAEHEIEKLKERGELYEPRQGHLRTT